MNKTKVMTWQRWKQRGWPRIWVKKKRKKKQYTEKRRMRKKIVTKSTRWKKKKRHNEEDNEERWEEEACMQKFSLSPEQFHFHRQPRSWNNPGWEGRTECLAHSLNYAPRKSDTPVFCGYPVHQSNDTNVLCMKNAKQNLRWRKRKELQSIIRWGHTMGDHMLLACILPYFVCNFNSKNNEHSKQLTSVWPLICNFNSKINVCSRHLTSEWPLYTTGQETWNKISSEH